MFLTGREIRPENCRRRSRSRTSVVVVGFGSTALACKVMDDGCIGWMGREADEERK